MMLESLEIFVTLKRQLEMLMILGSDQQTIPVCHFFGGLPWTSAYNDEQWNSDLKWHFNFKIVTNKHLTTDLNRIECFKL